ncbi:4-hydroxybenzoate 3-monooxygenase [Streptomyces sp. SID3343]|uniref:4-hydroxybenzoate 3-monooxygenase n=1 Tax=Streptomyces sp. SID3343 TaxID=2690260 RepID=UPI00136DB764|nr:4-hydroxybenzoate 3-monooxygenase [Streptomyces sp. SID3343]MYW06518.1 4-hydroxybenzoate 3-monooxygenase [Streptomyces sp. SID3343]
MRTQVGIIGAGPAGLLLSQLLHNQGIDSVVLEARGREYCEQRRRAGMLEQSTVDALRAAGAADRLDREGLLHHGIHLRFAGRDRHIDFPSRTGGKSVTVYGQTEIVKDLIAKRVDEGARLYFDTPVTAIEGIDSDAPRIRFVRDGVEQTLECDVIAGCDGFHGVARPALPAHVLKTFERVYPFAWLGILADVAPSTDDLIYAYSDRGFALHSMRSASVSRLYLQVEPDAKVEDWPDVRIWAELHERFAVPGWRLDEGPITDKSITPMRSFVAEPMSFGRLFLAGDAAHVVPPTGAKGLNLAMADVRVLADACVEWFGRGSRAGLDAYSDTCLRRVWRAEHFSYWMTTLLHVDPSAPEFDRRCRLAHLAYVADSEAAMTTLAENYVGYDWNGDD